MISEEQLYFQIRDWMHLQYPDVMPHFDYGSGARLTKRAAVAQAKLNDRGYPDLVILEPNKNYHGLFIELKRPGTRLKKKDGTWASAHLAEQNEYLQRLEAKGYAAYFAVGFDQTVEIINDYMGKSDE